MAVNPIPPGYHTVTPYLTVDDLGKLIAFIESAFGGKVIEHIADDSGKPRHAEMQVGDSKLMIGQARSEWPARTASLYVYVEDTDATYARALRAGAKSIMEPSDQFYGDRNAGVEDEAGNYWWIATHVEDVSPEELQRRMAQMKKS